jgi:hypothetical protein
VACKAEETPVSKPEDDRTEERATRELGVDELKSIKDASEFLEQHGDHPGITDDATAKAACRYHAKALSDVHAAHGEGEGDDEEEGMSEADKSLAKSLIAKIKAEIEENEAWLSQLAS